MAEQIARQFDDLRRQIETLESRLQATTAKDLSLVSLVPTWSGSPKAGPLQAFLTSVETTVEVGSWTDPDKVRIASLKLTETARAFYDVTPELHDRALKRSEFKSLLQQRYRDPPSTLQDAIKIEVTVEQAEARDHKSDAFIVNGRPENTRRSRSREREKFPHRRKF
jgi:hypothetical protein